LKRRENEQSLANLSLVLGYLAVKEYERLEDQVKVLARLGYGNAEIARICDTTLATVSTLKSRPKTRKSK
jgi:transcriptional regulator